MGIQLHDQTFATRLRTEDMLDVAPLMDEVGFFSVEVWGGANEDPNATKRHELGCLPQLS